MPFWHFCEAKIKFHSRILRGECAIFGRNGILVCLFGKMEIDLCPAFEPVFIGFSVVLHAALGQIDFPFLRNFTLRYYMKGRSKNSKGAHPKSRKFKGEKRRNESIKARSTPFRSPPIIPQCFSKNHSKTRESKIFSYRFLRFLSKMANKKDPKHPEVLGSYNYFSVFVLFEFLLCPTSLLSKGTRNFPKRQRKNQEWSRGARSTPFRSLQSQFRESPVYSVRRNKKILRYCLEFPR